MIDLSRDEFRAVIAQARLAPSVHNVQPSRWRYRDGVIELFGDRSRSIPVADPAWRDWRISHGAAFEGLSIALARRGLGAHLQLLLPDQTTQRSDDLQPIAVATLVQTAAIEGQLPIATRFSWRGGFKPLDSDTTLNLDTLAVEQPDLRLIRERRAIEDTARLADAAGLHFIRDSSHRRELLQWMRLSRKHPDFERDGLNAEAMNLRAIEAWGAGLVLGPLFKGLDMIGLAAPITSEFAKARTAAAIALFHRPAGEDAFVSGRAFYRAWLAVEKAGFKGCPVSVLSDWPQSRRALHQRHGIGQDRSIISVFRIGKPSRNLQARHARLPVDELIV